MIRQVSYKEVFEDPAFAQLSREYGSECSIPLIGEINLQPQIYDALERNGALRCFAAYEGGLIGFGSVLFTVMPHYGKRVATVESIFVAKGKRAAAGAELMRAIEDCAKQNSCVAILYSAPANGSLERLLSLHKSYKQTNTIFCRPL